MTKRWTILALLVISAAAHADGDASQSATPVVNAAQAAAGPAPTPAATPVPTEVSVSPVAAPTQAPSAALAIGAASDDSNRKVSLGAAYGANLFAGLAVGALVGTAAGAIPYATQRHNQGPSSVVDGAVYGSLAGVIALGLPLSAWEVASDKPGTGIDVLYNTLGFAVLGSAVGAGAGMISYSRTQSYAPNAGENFTAAAAAGVCAGALVGLGIGIADADWPAKTAKIPGKGIHASAGLIRVAMFLDEGGTMRLLPNATLLKAEF